MSTLLIIVLGVAVYLSVVAIYLAVTFTAMVVAIKVAAGLLLIFGNTAWIEAVVRIIVRCLGCQ